MEQLLTTKLFIPKPRTDLVSRPRLIEQLNDGLHRKLTLISAPAGFGKTTLVSEWVGNCAQPVAWLSLDQEDSDLRRFLTYLVAALQTLSTDLGKDVLGMLQSSQSLPSESVLTTLLNEIAAIPGDFTLVFDDYHVIDAKPIDHALAFLLERSPPQMHLVITTREDPNLSLARLRARGQLTEMRVGDLRFTHSEAAGFLNQMMGLNLSEENVAALEDRTEGWIAGLQLAAISMRGNKDTASFIKSFTGSHHFVLDYLVEEVLLQQPENIQTFLLCTSILDRLCGSLCDAVLPDPSTPGQETLEYIEGANLFLVPLDNERRWYRYHQLFADLLRQRLQEASIPGRGEKGIDVDVLHIRASRWFEENSLDVEAFEHAAAANDIERAERLMEGEGMPLQFRGAMAPVLNWLESLPTELMDARPSLWVAYASALTIVGKPVDSIEEILQSAEAALQKAEPDEEIRDHIGHLAAIRAMLAIPQNQVDTIVEQSRRALEYLHPENLSVRTTTTWTLGYAYQLQGDRAAAIQAHTEALSISQKSGNTMISIAAATSLGQIQESEAQLHQAVEHYRSVLDLAGDPPLPAACEAYLGLARIFYEWNDLGAAQKYGEHSLQLARNLENVDTPAACELLFTRLNLARGDVESADEKVANAESFVEQKNFTHLMPDVAALKTLVLLQQGDFAQAADLAEKHKLPISQARVYLSQGDTSSALTVLKSYRQQVEAKARCDELLRAMILQTVALHAHGEGEQAIQVLEEALALAEPGGFIRIFLDEGSPMAVLLSKISIQGIMPNYVSKLLEAFEAEEKGGESKAFRPPAQTLIEPLSGRELEVLQLIAQGLSNREIGERLFLALNTVKGHNRRIFNKLQVQRRTEAIARAHELDLL
ncbi:MAG: LuxR C-terminal-related transcriptional regulator [Anaerolineales bacterium]